MRDREMKQLKLAMIELPPVKTMGVETRSSGKQNREHCNNPKAGLHSVFDYCYRDAANYKAWGALLLEGRISKKNICLIVSKLEGGEFFIAEQLTIPTLYHGLWVLSGGPTDEDHVWHQFHELRPATDEELSLPVWGTINELVARFQVSNGGMKAINFIGVLEMIKITCFHYTGALFSAIDPEIAAGHPDYERNYRLLEWIRQASMFGGFLASLGIWALALEGVVLKGELTAVLEASRRGVPVSQILQERDASSGMMAFGEGLEVMYLEFIGSKSIFLSRQNHQPSR